MKKRKRFKKTAAVKHQDCVSFHWFDMEGMSLFHHYMRVQMNSWCDTTAPVSSGNLLPRSLHLLNGSPAFSNPSERLISASWLCFSPWWLACVWIFRRSLQLQLYLPATAKQYNSSGQNDCEDCHVLSCTRQVWLGWRDVENNSLSQELSSVWLILCCT